MPDDLRGERTEQATPRRRLEARERGNVPRSVDFSAALLLLATFGLLYYLGRALLLDLGLIEERILRALDRPPVDVADVTALAADLAAAVGTALLPLLLGMLVVAIAVNLLQTGVVWSGHPLTPDWGRLNPVSGFGRLFSLQSGVRLVMSLLKMAALTAGVWWVVQQEIAGMGALASQDAGGILAAVSAAVFRAALKLAAMLLLLGFLDYLFQRWNYERDLRMTKQEVRDELRRYEGDPHIRQRRQQIQRQLARQRMMKAVEKADVVITNPTELAVALQYDPQAMASPRVVAKGARLMALRIRQVAADAGVPIVERKPLAQALYKACKVGDAIPETLYKAVAEVLGFIYGLDPEKRRHFVPTGAGR